MIFRIIAISILALVSLSCSSKDENQTLDTGKNGSPLENARNADQLTVFKPYKGGKDLRGNAGITVATIKGEKNIQEFLDLVTFNENADRAPCYCEASYQLKFLREGKELSAIGYQHLSVFQMTPGVWENDKYLTDKSITDIIKWFGKQGFKEPGIEYQIMLREQKIREKRFAFLLQYFDKERQEILQLLNRVEHPSDPSIVSEAEVSKRLYNSYDDKTLLIDSAVKIFGSKESAGGYDIFEQAIIKAVARIKEDSFSKYLDGKQKMSEVEKRGICCFLLFQYRLTKPLYEQHKEKITGLIKLWLEQEQDYELAFIGLNTIFLLNVPELNEIYDPYVKGEKEFDLKRRSESIAPNISFRHLLLLKRAEQGDKSVLQYCDELLEGENTAIEHSILKIAKALINGDLSELKVEDFDHRVSILTRSRVLLAEKYPSMKSYDLLVAGTTHSFSNVRTQCVLAMQKLTGTQWCKEEDKKRADKHGIEVRTWWAKERESYEFSTNLADPDK